MTALDKNAKIRQELLAASRPAEKLDPKFPYEQVLTIRYEATTPRSFDVGKASQGFSAKFRAKISFTGSK
jgi:hypothetical protein